MYLNKVYFGDGLYGVEAAARGYFGKSASDLTVDEAALLAGLIQSPSAYAPTGNLDRALARRAVVLQTMVNSGAIDAPTAERAKKMPVKLVNGLDVNESSGQYFKEAVRRELVDRFGWPRVSQGGLRVFTTLDIDLQRSAEALVEKNLKDIEGRRGFTHTPREKLPRVKEGETPDYLQGALISIDPTNGYVLALVGGRDFTESRFNRPLQAKRQSGSAFKPFVYAAALEAGYTPATLITRLNDPLLVNEEEWLPEDEHSTADSMTLRAALRTSSNRAAVQLLNTVGIAKAVSAAEKMNVGTPPSVPSLALGASDVTLSALTAAYGAFANGGIVRKPVLIRRVEDSDGQVLYNEPGKADRAVSESTAFLMASMLADVINAGTAYRARQSGFTLPAAGKTGTTNDYVDAWFVGFTPKLVTGVWIGFDQPKTIIRNGYAGEIAVPLWAGFMKVATKDDKPEWLARPANVIGTNVCRISGKLPAGGCDHVEVVNRDGLPREAVDDLHRVFRQGHTADRTVSAARRPRLPRCAGRGLRQGLGPAAHARRCDRPAGAADSAEHRGNRECARPARCCGSRAGPEEARLLVARLRRRRPRQEGRGQKEGRAEEKVRRVIGFSRPTCPFDISPGTASSSISLRARLPEVPCRPASSSRGPTESGNGSLRSRWRSCSIARAWPARRTASSRPTRAAIAAPAAASRAACTPTCSSSSRGTPVRSRWIRCVRPSSARPTGRSRAGVAW